MEKLVLSLGIIFLGLVLGYGFQILVHKKIVLPPYDIETIRKALQKIVLLYITPVTILASIWILNLDDLKLIALPFIGGSALILGGVVAYFFARMLRMDRKQTGTYIVTGSFTNIGLMGGLLCFVFLGEAGYALMAFYKLFVQVIYFGIGFPIAKSYSLVDNRPDKTLRRMWRVFADPLMFVPIASIFVAFALNISGIKRPDVFASINAVLVPMATILMLSSIGMAIRFERIGKYIKEGLLIALIKFVIVPTVAFTIAYMVGLGRIEGGLPLKVVMILSSMPVAFTAMVPPTLYDLDVDLANANWLVTNLLLVLVVPVLHYRITLF